MYACVADNTFGKVVHVGSWGVRVQPVWLVQNQPVTNWVVDIFAVVSHVCLVRTQPLR